MRLLVDTLAETARMGTLATIAWGLLAVAGVPLAIDVMVATGLLVMPVCLVWGVVERFDDLGED